MNSLRDPIKYRAIPPEDKFNCKRYLLPRIIDIGGRVYTEVFKEKKYNLQLLNNLSEEINKEFRKCNHKIEFNTSLPFSGKLFTLIFLFLNVFSIISKRGQTVDFQGISR